MALGLQVDCPLRRICKGNLLVAAILGRTRMKWGTSRASLRHRLL